MSFDFIKYIKNGDFVGAKKCISNLSFQELHNFIIEFGFDTGSIALYSFVLFLLMQRESAELHYCAAVLMGQALVYIEDAYAVAFFHAQRAVDLAPIDTSYKEYLLLYYYIPEKLLSFEKAKHIAEELLINNSNNSVANQFFLDTYGKGSIDKKN